MASSSWDSHDQADGSSKVKVTILASEWGSSEGEVSTVNRELAIQLAKFPAVEVIFFLPQCSEVDKNKARKHNVNIIEAKRRPGFEELELLSFPPEDLPIDFIVGHGVKLGHQAQVIKERKGCKWIQVVHTDPEELGMFKSHRKPISKGEEKLKAEVELCKMADLVVGVGPKLSEAYRSHLSFCQKDQSVFDFTPGIFDEFVCVKQVHKDRKYCKVLVFGSEDPEDNFTLKGFDIAGKAVATIPDTCLLFVGAPDEKREEVANRLTDCGVPRNRLKVRGLVKSREHLKQLFHEVDLLLMPSRTEDFGLAGLEALSAGLPVLVCQNSGFGEALSKVPFGLSSVVDSEDPKEWATAIKQIWDKDREMRLKEAETLRNNYGKEYNWAKQIKDLLDKMISTVHGYNSSDGQSSTQTKDGIYQSAGQASQQTVDLTGHHTARSIVSSLQKMQCDADNVNSKTNLSVDLRKIASEHGFVTSDNPASGDCMFYALAEQLQSVNGIQISHRELRKTVVQFLTENPDMGDGTPLFNFVSGYPSWPEYLASMAKDGTWGDHLVLLTAANYFKTHIRIISSLGSDIVICPDHAVADTNDPLVLGHVHEEHYVSLQPRRKETDFRGRLAFEAYNKALTEGKACVKRVPVMLIGQHHSGKTSLKKSLMGIHFNSGEDSTVGIDVDPSHFKVSREIWKAEENDQATNAFEAFSKELHTALLVTEYLKQENSPLSIPVLAATLMKKLQLLTQEVEEDTHLDFWDFAGQQVYYAVHPLFLTARAMYILVYDLGQDPHGTAKPIVRQGIYCHIVDDHGIKTNLDYLHFWMTSIASLASQDEDQEVRFGPKSKVLRVQIPLVFLVCTHADNPYGGANPFALAHKVFDSLQTNPFRDHLYNDVFVVDNTKSGTESECSEVKRLREKVLTVAKELPQVKESIPIKWWKYEKALQGTVKEGRKWISLEMAKQIASEVCRIKDDQEFLTLLNFLHDQRILIHFDDTPVLNNMVVLDPQWLVDVFKKVITVTPYDHNQDQDHDELWRRLEKRGILDEKLLEHVWGPLFDQQETSASLIEMMEKFSLLCPWPSSDASCGKQYLVPSMLMSHPPQDIIDLVVSAQIPSLFLKFESGQVPPGLFPRLVLQFFQWGEGEFWSAENPQLYHSFARFYTSKDEGCSVILLCHSSSIEVVVHRGNLSTDLEESLQSELNISANTHYDAFEVACAQAVRKQLGLMLECMRKEFCWLKNMKYEEGFICSVCCQGHAVKYCTTHHKQGCEQEECLHFWSESDLRSSKQFVRCRKCATAQSDKVHVKQFAPWISETSDEQHTTDESGGRLLVSVGGNHEKLLALPSNALEPLLSQPCNSKEVVLQLKDSLQLDQASLEQPNPGTKRLIRCLAIKAKESGRVDVVKHLREITPAGTTGPLLPERLDIRNIPVRQMTNLTVELSGGEDWKLVAEELGLTPQEIRFLDKRTLNPCEAVLTFISRQRDLSVGALYDLLNKCGLPVAADIL